MKYLLDTCILSELQKPNCNPQLLNFISNIADSNLYLSSLSLGEIKMGIELLDDGSRKIGLLEWLDGLESQYSSQILPLDMQTCYIWGEITAKARKEGKQVPAIDGLISATAMQHHLCVITRNVKDFEATGIQLINPWLG